jgi:SAM-dependent methyltransferase
VSFQDHFSDLAKVYAKSRPTHPPALFAAFAALAPGRELAWDCGTGNGQAAHGLAEHFDRVVATEPSEAQLAQAIPHPRITYARSAETAPMLADKSVDLVTAAQAVHWFDLSIFYPEVRRVLRPGGVLAVFNYGICRVSPEIDRVLMRLYADTLGPYWPPERRMAENNYRDLHFPFPEIKFPRMELERDWTLEEFANFIRTWSAVGLYRKATGRDPVDGMAAELGAVWGLGSRRVSWLVAGRIARVD